MKENEHFNKQSYRAGWMRKCRLREARQRILGYPATELGSGSEASQHLTLAPTPIVSFKTWGLGAAWLHSLYDLGQVTSLPPSPGFLTLLPAVGLCLVGSESPASGAT